MVASQLDAMRSSLLLVLAGSVLALVALWRVRQPPRSSLLAIPFLGRHGAHRLAALLPSGPSGDPAPTALAALIFLAQGITGPRDLLEIPLSWQKATIWSCDFSLRTCPPLAPPGCSAACCQLIRQTSNMVPWCRRCSDEPGGSDGSIRKNRLARSG